MHTTKIQAFKIAQTRVNWGAVRDWLAFIGVKDVDGVFRQLCTGTMEQWMASDATTPAPEVVATDASALIALAAKRCYMSFEKELNPNLTQIRTDHAQYIENVLKVGHGSVTEHASWTFAVENVSRVFTGEMNRHRAGVAVSEGSMRFIRFDDIGYWTPTSIADDNQWIDGLLQETGDMTAEEAVQAKAATRELFGNAFQTMEKWNLDLSRIWKIDTMKNFTVKKILTSMFRRLIGMGISTGGVWTLNARALRWVIQQRGSALAEEEIYHVFDEIATVMVEDEPLLFGDFERDADGFWAPKHRKV